MDDLFVYAAFRKIDMNIFHRLIDLRDGDAISGLYTETIDLLLEKERLPESEIEKEHLGNKRDYKDDY